jgi:hypothetical protein
MTLRIKKLCYLLQWRVYRGNNNIGADELVKKGFKATTIEAGYNAWKEENKNKK